jgi:hypothetical protein
MEALGAPEESLEPGENVTQAGIESLTTFSRKRLPGT